MWHSKNYLKNLRAENPGAAESVEKTMKAIKAEQLDKFTFMDHERGLLLGQVQSGKTGQMFGVMCAAADSDFELFIVLTSGMTALQKQTFERALAHIDTFNICGENDEVRFRAGAMRKPTAIILKKNSRILYKWKNEIAASGFAEGRSIFIIDDEADATSLNTKVNKKEKAERSTINQYLTDISRLGTSSFYLQVTATPQALILQTLDSDWKPEFVHYFAPGSGYLGGDFFYPEKKPFSYVETPDDELTVLTETPEIPPGMQKAAATYLVTLAHQVSVGKSVCNFLVHPSSKINDHTIIAKKLNRFLTKLLADPESPANKQLISDAHENLQTSKPDLLEIKKVINFLSSRPTLNFVTMNSGPDGEVAPDTESGFNVIVGGNSLGRGVTFKSLQTVYYLRSAKKPQADTFWQHARMFGYDRDQALMRVFMPDGLYNLFSELNNSNQALYEQIEGGHFKDLQIMLPPGVKPTRDAVIDLHKLEVLVGGVNYFPPDPDQTNVRKLDPVLASFEDTEKYHLVDTQTMVAILSLIRNDKVNSWAIQAYVTALRSLAAQKNYNDEIALIVRRGRDIGKGTGTMLSPDDRKLGGNLGNMPVVTLYRNEGSETKGWNGAPFWMPNVKLPSGRVFFVGES